MGAWLPWLVLAVLQAPPFWASTSLKLLPFQATCCPCARNAESIRGGRRCGSSRRSYHAVLPVRFSLSLSLSPYYFSILIILFSFGFALFTLPFCLQQQFSLFALLTTSFFERLYTDSPVRRRCGLLSGEFFHFDKSTEIKLCCVPKSCQCKCHMSMRRYVVYTRIARFYWSATGATPPLCEALISFRHCRLRREKIERERDELITYNRYSIVSIFAAHNNVL